LILAVSAALAGALSACESPRPAPSRPADVPSAGSVDHQQREVEGRIEQAFRSGRLTRDEHRMLKNQADEIRREERRHMADGNVSASEKQALLSRLQNLSREVERQSSDAQRR
jgi:hypothetical protein